MHTGNPQLRDQGVRQAPKPHVYRNPCTHTWICDWRGTRAAPGPERFRTVHRTQPNAVQAALLTAPATSGAGA